MKSKTDLWIWIFLYGFLAHLMIEASRESVLFGGLAVVGLAVISAILAVNFGKEENGSSNPEQSEG